MRPPRIAYLLLHFPFHTETFVAEEIQAIRQLGLEVRIISLLGPGPGPAQPLSQQMCLPMSGCTRSVVPRAVESAIPLCIQLTGRVLETVGASVAPATPTKTLGVDGQAPGDIPQSCGSSIPPQG